MKVVEHQPNAASIMGSMRAIGYTFEAAVADVFDNSLAAGAVNLRLEFRRDPTFVALIDDGHGMSPNELVDAMRFGSKSPLEYRSATDHGRFGLGLKTASLSQCRRLTVISKRNGDIAGARWDLDHVERLNSWSLILLDADQLQAVPCVDLLSQNPAGTLVVWERFDRLGAAEGSKAAADTLVRLVSESSAAMSLVFHRFLDGSSGKRIQIKVNGAQISASDPYFTSNEFTRVAGKESALVDGHPISAIAYILPNLVHLSPSELKMAGGESALKDHQGFFVYRNCRLITYGTWFKLAPREELTRLARIAVDVDNSIDHEWQLDVKKGMAFPSPSARNFLASMVQCVAQESKRRIIARPSAGQLALNQAVWIRSIAQDKVNYVINRSHPLVIRLLSHMSSSDCEGVESLLAAIELALPLKQISFDDASQVEVGHDSERVKRDLSALLENILDGLNEIERRSILVEIPNLEPFRSHASITSDLIGALSG